MDIEQLKAILARQEEHLKSSGVAVVVSSPNGPIGVSVVRALVELAALQQERIEKLEEAVKAVSRS